MSVECDVFSISVLGTLNRFGWVFVDPRSGLSDALLSVALDSLFAVVTD